MSDQMVQQVLARLDALAAKLGTTAQYLWGVLLRQAQVEAWTDLAIAIIFIVVGIAASVGLVKAIKVWKSEPERGYLSDTTENVCIAFFIGYPIVMIVSLWVSLYQIIEAAQILINPAYWALQHLL